MPEALLLALLSPLPITKVPSTTPGFVAGMGADDARAPGLTRQIAIHGGRVVTTMPIGYGHREP
jgi:hypothetical protein